MCREILVDGAEAKHSSNRVTNVSELIQSKPYIEVPAEIYSTQSLIQTILTTNLNEKENYENKHQIWRIKGTRVKIRKI